MKRFINIMSGVLFMAVLGGCLKDNGNYTYKTGRPVTISWATSNITGLFGDTIRVSPNIKYNNPQDTLGYKFQWYVDGYLVSTNRNLTYVTSSPFSQYVYYYVTDTLSGTTYSAPVTFIQASSPFANGWGILYEKNGKSELGHVRVSGTSYFDYQDLYKAGNNGEEMGTGPVKIKDYAVRSGRALYVIQRGGQGCMELDGYTMKRMLRASDAFVGGVPANFAPVDCGFYSDADYLINKDGDVYSRGFNGALPFTVPFQAVPVSISRGLKVTDIWDSFSGTSTFALMYDKLNKRVLKMVTNLFNTNGGNQIDTLVLPVGGYPDNYTPLQNFGAWEYVWGGTFNDVNPTMDGAVIMRNPADGKLYFETFNYNVASSGVEKLTPKSRILFPADPYITADTKFAPLKTRDYLFFTSGANNDMLYYYDVKSESIVKLYAQLGARINVIQAADDFNTLAVGLDDGTFILFDVSNATIISGSSKELHRFGGLGKVVDICVRPGKTN